jgi:hypothetical protein
MAIIQNEHYKVYLYLLLRNIDIRDGCDGDLGLLCLFEEGVEEDDVVVVGPLPL